LALVSSNSCPSIQCDEQNPCEPCCYPSDLPNQCFGGRPVPMTWDAALQVWHKTLMVPPGITYYGFSCDASCGNGSRNSSGSDPAAAAASSTTAGSSGLLKRLFVRGAPSTADGRILLRLPVRAGALRPCQGAAKCDRHDQATVVPEGEEEEREQGEDASRFESVWTPHDSIFADSADGGGLWATTRDSFPDDLVELEVCMCTTLGRLLLGLARVDIDICHVPPQCALS